MCIRDSAKTFAGQIKICKMNVDENTENPAKFGVRGIPALLVFNGGELVATKIGALTQGQLDDFIRESVDL